MSEDRGLLDHAFLAQLARLSLRARRRFVGRSQGEKRSVRLGSGLEFAGHRGYVAGDDLRHLDWALLGRLDRPFMKLFQQETDLTVHLLVDNSRSMSFGEPSKFRAAARLAAALGYIALASLDRVSAGLFDGDGLRFHGPGRGRGALFPFLSFLESGTADGPPGLAGGLRLHAAAAKPGLTVIFSDCFEPRFTEALLPHRYRRHSVVLVQVLAREELDPPHLGDVKLVDAETGAELEITVGRRERSAYLARLREQREELESFGLRHGMEVVSLPSHLPLRDALWEHLFRTTLLTGG